MSIVNEDGLAGRFYPVYDGNGNVISYLDNEGVSQAYFSYDQFGMLVGSGGAASKFFFRFSTKYEDLETGLNYYGYRYYDSQQGRWLGRDPLEESDGPNLYAFLKNDGVNWSDLLGLFQDEAGNEFSGPPCCKGRAGEDWATDAAGRRCCSGEIADIELQIEMGSIGHAQLQLPNEGDNAHGFFPTTDIILPGGGSYIYGPHDYDPEYTRKYKACPGSVEEVKKSIEKNKKAKYSTTNLGGSNCASWSCKRLKDAGFDPPFGSDFPLVQPKNLIPQFFKWNDKPYN